MRRHLRALTAVLAAFLTAVVFTGPALGEDSGWGLGRDRVETVSPGALTEIPTAADSCPTFSWAPPDGGDGTHGLALRIFEARLEGTSPPAADAGADLGPAVLEVFLPSGATSWTPPLERCLESGSVYGWELELVDGPVLARSRPRWFRVSTQPSPSEVERAVEVLRRHLEGAERADRAARADGRAGASPIGNRSPVKDDEATRVGTAGGAGSSGLGISGGLQVQALRSERTSGSFGELAVSGDLFSNGVETAAAIVGTGPLSTRQTLWAPEPGSLLLCDAEAIQFPTANEPRESPCGLEVPDSQAPGGAVYVPVNGDFSAGLIVTRALVVAADGNGGVAGAGIQVPQGDWTAGGGSGYASVGADGGKVDYDNNESPCPANTVAIGARLFHAGGDQVGIKVKCSSP